MKAKMDRKARLVAAWETKRYATIAALARKFHVTRQYAWTVLTKAGCDTCKKPGLRWRPILVKIR